MDMNKKIIVVEDERDINNLIAYNLRKENFSVEQAFDGNEAMKKLNGERFNIVILDLMLPGVDGFTICNRIKNDKNCFKTFVIIVSARNNHQDKLYAHLQGADFYITKPFSVGMLMDTVEELSLLQDKEYLVTKIIKN